MVPDRNFISTQLTDLDSNTEMTYYTGISDKKENRMPSGERVTTHWPIDYYKSQEHLKK